MRFIINSNENGIMVKVEKISSISIANCFSNFIAMNNAPIEIWNINEFIRNKLLKVLFL